MTVPIQSDKPLQALLQLLIESRFSYFSSVRPDGRPHCVPIWHVVDRGNIYMAVHSHSVKAANVRSNPNVVVVARLDIPEAGLIVEGRAQLRPDLRPTVSQFFEVKYEWKIIESEEYDTLIQIEPERLIAWGQYGEGRWSGEQVRRAARPQG